MNPLTSLLLAAALSLAPPWYAPGKAPETPEQYRSRLRTIAVAVAAEVPDRRWGAAVLTVWHRESRFALDVHSGEKLGDRGRARCLGQLHVNANLPREQWERTSGTDIESTRRCARETYRALRSAYRWCRARHPGAGMAEAYSLFGTGRTCKHPLGVRRAKTYRRLLDVMRRHPAHGPTRLAEL